MSRLPAWACFGLVLGGTAAAQELPIVRATLSPEIVNVGESAELNVTVLVPTWFPRPPVFPSFELANAITRLPPNSSFPTSERVGRETWSGIVRNYSVSPLLGAHYRLSGMSMTVTYADPDTREPVTLEIVVPDVEFRARVPVGAEGIEPYLGGRELGLTRESIGNAESLEIGDAVVLQYVAELDGLPAIFLPPLAPPLELNGLSVYVDEATVEDGPPARRIERQTLVFEAGGEFVLPAVEFDWWNTESNTIETAFLPPLALIVAGPAVAVEAAQVPARTDLRLYLGLFLILLISVALIVRLRPRLRRAYSERRERVLSSESYTFKQVRQSLRAGEAHAAHQSLLRWLHRLRHGLDLRQFASRYGDDELGRQLDRLSSAVYSGSTSAIDLRILDGLLVRARRNFLDSRGGRRQLALPPLNP